MDTHGAKLLAAGHELKILDDYLDVFCPAANLSLIPFIDGIIHLSRGETARSRYLGTFCDDSAIVPVKRRRGTLPRAAKLTGDV